MDYYQQSLTIQEEIGDRYGEAASWFNSGNALAKLGQKSEAIAAYQNARELYQAMGLDAKVQDCNNKIQRLEGAGKGNLFQTAVRWLLPWVH